MIERYKRVDRNTMSLQLVVEDPKAYTSTWVGDTKTYKLLTGKKAYMEELLLHSGRRGCLHQSDQNARGRAEPQVAQASSLWAFSDFIESRKIKTHRLKPVLLKPTSPDTCSLPCCSPATQTTFFPWDRC